MIQIRDGIGYSDEKSDAGQGAVNGGVFAGIENEARGNAVGDGGQYGHRGRRGGIGAAKTRDFHRGTPLTLEHVAVIERGEIGAIEAGGVSTAKKPNSFIEIEMVLGEILAEQKIDAVADCSYAGRAGAGRKRSGVQE